MDAQGTAFDFAGMRRDINARLLKDKERYPEGWKGQGIDSRLDKTLQKVERYVELNRQPTRKEQMQRAVTDISTRWLTNWTAESEKRSGIVYTTCGRD